MDDSRRNDIGGHARIPGFHRLGMAERLAAVAAAAKLDPEEVAAFAAASRPQAELMDHMAENAIGAFAVPLGVAVNLVVDGDPVLVPMATEESSVVAAVCNGARRCLPAGGVFTSADAPRMIAQVQLTGLRDPFGARARALEHVEEIRAICDACDPMLVELGGGFRELDARVVDGGPGVPPMLVCHLVVDVRDAMGANAVNTMAETVAPRLAEWTGGKAGLRILSNLADRRVVRARAVWPLDQIGGPEGRDGVIAASHFASADPYRAATHNKGIMNGVCAVALATGNDTRALEAGAHAYAARSGRYTALSRFEATQEGDLTGVIEMPMPVGVVGGATRTHPTAQLALKIMGATGADRLARVMASVGLIQNFAAMFALSTVGIQKGHMALHAKNLAVAAGAAGELVEAVAARMIEEKAINGRAAARILAELSGR
ncbi:hydroxymethylglutaryl-CoA reductase, degradative [Rhodovulum sp. DZ06]|uniref:hydroxymethylglutaryl-CoA reductase, degradative n=1 Tax=Rhodovulum sp. DZ06 TaxID=3425126 RepID=UPI003D32BA96